MVSLGNLLVATHWVWPSRLPAVSEDTNDQAAATNAADTEADDTEADDTANAAAGEPTVGAKYAFLSEAWVTKARAIRKQFRSDAPTPPAPPASPGVPTTTLAAVKMNQIVTDVPFGTGTIESHLDTSQGEMDLELGHMHDAEVTLTLDYDTAKAILVDGNPQVAMNAFMAGKIRVTGDVTRLIALQTWAAAPDPASIAIARAIRAITE